MKFISFIVYGEQRLGIDLNNGIVDVNLAGAYYLYASGKFQDYRLAKKVIPTDLLNFINGSPYYKSLVDEAITYLNKVEWKLDKSITLGRPIYYSWSEIEVSAPLNNPSKIVAIGLNYYNHAQESNMNVPESPIFFTKYPNSIIGPNCDITFSRDITDQVDFEVELAVIISKKARKISRENALDYVFGYTILNDISARNLQFENGQWVKGKSLDTFSPIGPCVVTSDSLNLDNALLTLDVNGERMQEGKTSDLIFDIPSLIESLSSLFTLEPGDIISTGTPSGVGFARKPPVFLQPGDDVTAKIEGIGVLKNKVV